MQNINAIALVTGASRGIGLSTARKLLDGGYRVIGTTRRTAFPDRLSDHARFEGLEVDLARPDNLSETIKPLFQRDEPPTVLINNAGISEPADTSLDDGRWLRNWDKTLQVTCARRH